MSQSSPLEIGLTISDGAPTIYCDRLTELLQRAAATHDGHGEIGIWICTDDEIADLHQRFMNIDGPTDVLSFTGDPPYLGDVAVSYETAEMQARDLDHPVQREIAYLALHGLLHLLGYDDLTKHDRERMLAHQDELIDAYETSLSNGWT